MADNVHIQVLEREHNRFKIYVYTKDDPDYCFTQLQYSVNGQPWYNYTPDGPAWGVAPLYISNLNPYTTYTIQARVKWVGESDFGGIYTITARTLGNATINTTYTVQPDASSPLLHIRIRLNVFASGLYYKLRILCGTPLDEWSSPVRINTTGATDQTFEYQAQVRAAAISCFGTGTKSNTCTLEVKTFSDQACTKQIDSSSVKTRVAMVLSEAYSKPSFSNFSFQDTVAEITAVTGSNQIMLQNFSKLKITTNRASANNGAELAKFEVIVGRVTKTSTVSNYATTISSRNITFGVIGTYGDNTPITVRVTDTRGFKTTVTKYAKVIKYDRPKFSKYIVNREDEVEETLNFDLAGSISSIKPSSEEVNSLQLATLSYKRASETTWTNLPILSRLTINGMNFSYAVSELLDDQSQAIRFEENTTYDFRITLRDILGTLTEYVHDVVIPAATGALMILGRTTSYPFPRVGINQAKPTEALDVVGNIKLSGVIKTPTGQVMSFAGDVDGSSLSNAAYKKTGLYFVPYEAGTYEPSNMPISEPGFLEVYATASGYVLQRFTAAITAAVYVRTYYSSWSSWRSL